MNISPATHVVSDVNVNLGGFLDDNLLHISLISDLNQNIGFELN